MKTRVWLVACAASCVLVGGPGPATAVTITHLIGDKDHLAGPYNEGSPAQINPGDPIGFDWGYHAGAGLSEDDGIPANLAWTHHINTTGVTIDSLTLNVAVIGFFLGPAYEKLFVGNPLAEIPGAFVGVNDGWQQFSFSIDPALLVNGDLDVGLFVSHHEGWGGVDYSELIAQATPVPEPATLALAGLGLSALAFRRRTS